MALVTILTPSYNSGPFISDAIASIREQRGAGAMATQIVADGGSTDGTLDVLASIDSAADFRYFSAPDKGQSDALNKALSLVQTPWIGWLNADEFYTSGAFERIRPALENPTVDVVYGEALFCDKTGRQLRLRGGYPQAETLLGRYGCNLSSCATFIRTAAVRNAGGWNEGLRRCMDWDLWLRLRDRGARFSFLASDLAVFRVHENQVTAAPERPTDPDFALLRELHPSLSTPITAGSHAGRLRHIAKKMAGGTYLRELGAAFHRGQDLRWWA